MGFISDEGIIASVDDKLGQVFTFAANVIAVGVIFYGAKQVYNVVVTKDWANIVGPGTAVLVGSLWISGFGMVLDGPIGIWDQQVASPLGVIVEQDHDTFQVFRYGDDDGWDEQEAEFY